MNNYAIDKSWRTANRAHACMHHSIGILAGLLIKITVLKTAWLELILNHARLASGPQVATLKSWEYRKAGNGTKLLPTSLTETRIITTIQISNDGVMIIQLKTA